MTSTSGEVMKVVVPVHENVIAEMDSGELTTMIVSSAEVEFARQSPQGFVSDIEVKYLRDAVIGDIVLSDRDMVAFMVTAIAL